jgi:hypothetical protein
MMGGEAPSDEGVVAAAGVGPQQVFAFWLVLIAAQAAWESKLNVPAVAAQATTKLA